MATNNAANLPKLTTDGQLLIGNSAGGPSAATLTAGSNTTITNGAGSVTIAFSGGGGKVLQQVRTTYSSRYTTTTSLPFDDTIPQNTEGDEIMTLSITPTSSTSILFVEVVVVIYPVDVGGIALFRDSTANAKVAVPIPNDAMNEIISVIPLRFWETSGSTALTTYKVRVGDSNAWGTEVNGDGASRLYGGVSATNMTITEYSS